MKIGTAGRGQSTAECFNLTAKVFLSVTHPAIARSEKAPGDGQKKRDVRLGDTPPEYNFSRRTPLATAAESTHGAQIRQKTLGRECDVVVLRGAV